MSIQKELFGTLDDGVAVYAYTLENATGIRATILNYGGTITQLWAPDRNGHLVDVLGGYDTLDFYRRASGYQGALVGRYGNRIALGRFNLEGTEYTLVQNNGCNHLHGGTRGFNDYIWDVTEKNGEEPMIVLHRVSPDGEEGYPGNLDVTVTYRLTKKGGLSIHYVAMTDQTTVVNLTNHSYFNLRGFNAGSALPLELTLDADTYLPTDDTMIPTGELRSVEGTPFDFRLPKTIGRDIGVDDADLLRGKGYDHCLNFTARELDGPIKRGELYDPESGRGMELYTDLPCVQLYTANWLTSKDFFFKGGYSQAPQTFVCLETQAMPDSPNKRGVAGFTDCTLRPGEVYDFTTEYRFFTK